MKMVLLRLSNQQYKTNLPYPKHRKTIREQMDKKKSTVGTKVKRKTFQTGCSKSKKVNSSRRPTDNCKE